MNEFVNELETVKKMIDNQEYQKANKKIEEMQQKIKDLETQIETLKNIDNV